MTGIEHDTTTQVAELSHSSTYIGNNIRLAATGIGNHALLLSRAFQ